jgi:hypothetical protein
MPVTMVLSQAGAAITGQFVANNMLFSTFVTSIASDGSVQLTGTNVTSSYITETTFSINSPALGQVTGTTYWDRRGNSGRVGGSVVEGTIVTVSRP